MSFDPTCRATQGATARPRADSPPPPPAVGATPAAAAAEPLSRQFDQLLRLDSGVGRSSRSQSIADRPRATLPASPASVPERLARLKGALVSYREKNAAAAPGRTAAQLRAIAEPAFRQANEALELLEGLKGPLRAKAVAEQLPAFVYQMRVSAAYQLAGAPPKDEALVLAINAVAHDGTPRELLLALLLKGIEHFDRRHEHAQRYKPILQAAIDKYGTPKASRLVANCHWPSWLQRTSNRRSNAVTVRRGSVFTARWDRSIAASCARRQC